MPFNILYCVFFFNYSTCLYGGRVSPCMYEFENVCWSECILMCDFLFFAVQVFFDLAVQTTRVHSSSTTTTDFHL